MARGLIELNDAGIVQAIDGEIRATSVGYAVLDGEQLLIGEPARQNARLLPRWTNHHFWQNLNTDPIPNATRGIRHHADIAFAQLEAIKSTLIEAESIVIAVPSAINKSQLSLLLGMASEAGLNVTGLVDASLLSVAGEDAPPRLMHLDVSLHQITLTSFEADTVLKKLECQIVTETGLFTLWDRWANIIARQFIQTSRYDPMHQAVSEQALFDTLPDWLIATAGKSSRSFELEVDGTKQSTTITQDQLVSACSGFYPQLVQHVRSLAPNGAKLYVSHRFEGFPGLAESLALIPNVDIQYLGRNAIVEAATQHWSRLSGQPGQISHITQLTLGKARPKAEVERPPTHLLVGWTATPLPHALHVGAIQEQGIREQSTQPAFTLLRREGAYFLLPGAANVAVNDTPVAAEVALKAGDVLSLDNMSAQLIRVG